MPCLLVADCDRAAVQTIRCAFHGTDITVESVESAAEAVAAIVRLHPDVVALAECDPGAVGLLERLRREDPRLAVLAMLSTRETAFEVMKRGVLDCLVKPLDIVRLRDLVGCAVRLVRLARVPVKIVSALDPAWPNEDLLIGNSASMREISLEIARLAKQQVNVLILGESGTGKELVARAIYQRSPRAAKQFLAVDCAAVAPPQLEIDLFGHESVSSAGAEVPRIGRFEQARGGTLMLDEVGDLTPLLQDKLLRAIRRRFPRSDSVPTASDVLLIATTRRDLPQLVADGRFRADLYDEFIASAIQLPPLRRRATDIPLLVEYFLQCANSALGRTVQEISAEALELLIRYPWPGNVRELQSALRLSLLQSAGKVLEADLLPRRLRLVAERRADGPTEPQPVPLDAFVEEELQADHNDVYARALAQMERMLLTRVLRRTGGNQSRAARILGITRGSLRNKIRLLRIVINQAVSVEHAGYHQGANTSVS